MKWRESWVGDSVSKRERFMGGKYYEEEGEVGGREALQVRGIEVSTV